MNVQGKMEAVLKAQEEAERKRIEETKFTRMTVEQQEIYLAKQKQVLRNCSLFTKNDPSNMKQSKKKLTKNDLEKDFSIDFTPKK